jgi:peptide/nickel transport system permease protein
VTMAVTVPSAGGPDAPMASSADVRHAGSGAVMRSLRGALRTRRGKVGAALALFVLGVAFLGPVISTGSTTAFVAPPFTKPGAGHGGLLGSDALGRSVLNRTLHGGWAIMLLAIAATTLSVVLGASAGVVSAYRRGWAENITMRGVDVVLAMPQLVFVLLLLSVIGPKWWLLIIAVGLSQAPQTARVIHAAAQNVCERDFVKAVAVWGIPPRTVLRRHVVPNLITPLMVEAGLRLSYSIILISGLSFLGLGTRPPNPDWGVMVNENRLGLGSNFWGVMAPAILLVLLAVGTNTFADAIARANLGEERGEEAVVASALAQVSED